MVAEQKDHRDQIVQLIALQIEHHVEHVEAGAVVALQNPGQGADPVERIDTLVRHQASTAKIMSAWRMASRPASPLRASMETVWAMR